MTMRKKRSLHLPLVGHRAPIPLGARVGNILCSSAIAGRDPADGQLPADAVAQVSHAFTNLQALLAAGGASPDHVVRLGVTVADDGLRDAVNAQWLALWPDADDRPARHIVISPLGHGMAIQIEVMAVISD